MRQHMREMSNMINEFKEVGHVLTDEQQVQVVIRSFHTIGSTSRCASYP